MARYSHSKRCGFPLSFRVPPHSVCSDVQRETVEPLLGRKWLLREPNAHEDALVLGVALGACSRDREPHPLKNPPFPSVGSIEKRKGTVRHPTKWVRESRYASTVPRLHVYRTEICIYTKWTPRDSHHRARSHCSPVRSGAEVFVFSSTRFGSVLSY